MTVRLLCDDERARFDDLLERKHYLCCANMVGRTLRYVAELDGVCYRACGFEAVGPTAGYARASRDFYHEHGEPKQLYLRELSTGARDLLRRARWPEALADQEAQIAGPCPFRAASLNSLLEQFKQLKDERRGHGLHHRQPFVLACAAAAGK